MGLYNIKYKCADERVEIFIECYKHIGPVIIDIQPLNKNGAKGLE